MVLRPFLVGKSQMKVTSMHMLRNETTSQSEFTRAGSYVSMATVII